MAWQQGCDPFGSVRASTWLTAIAVLAALAGALVGVLVALQACVWPFTLTVSH